MVWYVLIDDLIGAVHFSKQPCKPHTNHCTFFKCINHNQSLEEAAYMFYLVEENPMETPPTRMPMPKHYCMLFDSVHKQQFPTFCSFFIFCFRSSGCWCWTCQHVGWKTVWRKWEEGRGERESEGKARTEEGKGKGGKRRGGVGMGRREEKGEGREGKRRKEKGRGREGKEAEGRGREESWMEGRVVALFLSRTFNQLGYIEIGVLIAVGRKWSGAIRIPKRQPRWVAISLLLVPNMRGKWSSDPIFCQVHDH